MEVRPQADAAEVDDKKRQRMERLSESAGRMFDVIGRLIDHRLDAQWNRQKHERSRIDSLRREWTRAVIDFARVVAEILRSAWRGEHRF